MCRSKADGGRRCAGAVAAAPAGGTGPGLAARAGALRARWDDPAVAGSERAALARDLGGTLMDAAFLEAGDLAAVRVGALRFAAGGWTQEHAQAAALAGAPGTAPHRAAAGPYDEVLLTGDGEDVDRSAPCNCRGAEDAGIWVRFEKWTAEGRVG